MEIEALQLLSTQDGFDKHYDLIDKNRSYFILPAQTAVRHLKEYYTIQNKLDWQEYYSWLRLVKIPNLSQEDKETYDRFFKKLSTSEHNLSAQRSIIEALLARRAAERAIDIAEEISSGSDRYSIDDLKKVLEEYEDNLDVDEEDARVVSSDLDELLGAVLGDGLDWKQAWMNQSCGPLRKGDFVALVARPDSGKTSFLSGQANSFAKQSDRPVVWFNNEQEGRKVKLRIIQEAVGMSNVDMNIQKEKVKQLYKERVGDPNGVVVIDKAGITANEIESVCKEYKPSVIIIDQLWKVKGLGKEQTDVGTQTAIANWARELCKEYAPVVGVYQAGEAAEGRKYFGYECIYASKTAVAGEADLIICMGRTYDDSELNTRYFHFPKNKMAGGGQYFDERAKSMKHESTFNPETGVFK